MNEAVEIEFRSALEVARDALECFNAEPLIDSKRGGPRLSPFFRVWREASEIAARWHRQMDRAEDESPAAWRDEFEKLDRLLDDSQG